MTGLPARSVWIDAQGAQTAATAERGIPRHVVEITRAMIDTAPELIYAFGLNPEIAVPASLDHVLEFGRVGTASDDAGARAAPPPIFHIPSPFEFVRHDVLWPSWARRNDVRTVVTLHDLVPMLFPEHYHGSHPFAGPVFEARLDLLRGAHRVLAISQSTAADAVEQLGIAEDRISLIESGVSMEMASLAPSREEAVLRLNEALPRLRRRFVLYVGGADWRKNMEGMISAYGLLAAELREQFQLVIVCKLDRERRGELLGHARRAGVRRKDLLLTGFIPDAELAALYRACELFVFPSLYEGAGLPVLEAMSCGAPVAASRTASVPEILGDLRATFDPTDPADIASCMERTLPDADELAALRERSHRRAEHFTWGRVARKTIEAYEQAFRTPGRRVSRPRKQVAVLTPWPPVQAGAAADSRLIVEELATHAHIDVFVQDKGGDDPGYDRSLEPRIGLRGMAEFEWMQGLRDYDGFLYVLGDSPVYLHGLEALLRRPGLVLAHEERFIELYRALAAERYFFSPEWLLKKLEEMYGERVPERELERIADGKAEANGVLMSQEIQAQATGVLVGSPAAAESLRLDSPAGGAVAEIDVVGEDGDRFGRIAERCAVLLGL